MKPAVGYIRVSTEGQATEGVSLDAQTEKVKAWCTVSDCTLAGVFVDAGLSGGRADNRPELQKALNEVCRIKGALIVYSLSRLARSTRDTIAIAERLDKAGADLVSLSEKIDTTSAAGRMVFRMLAVLSEFERDQISERTSLALQHKRSKSELVGSVPYGYDLSPDGVGLTENAAEQLVLARIHQLKAAGASYGSIAQGLDADGITSKRGGRWHAKVVMDLCKRKPLKGLR